MLNKKTPYLTNILSCAIMVVSVSFLASCANNPKDISHLSANELYAGAQEEFDSGNYTKSIMYYERLEAVGAGTNLAQQAQLNKAYAYLKGNNRPMAIATLNRFIKLYPYSSAVDYALYLKGIAYFNDESSFLSFLSQQDLADRDPEATKQSFATFQQLVDNFPQSKYAPDARQRMQYIINSLAQHELNIAKFYYQHKAYVAAINRSKLAIEEYNAAPAQEEALYIMAHSYKQLNLEQPYQNTVKVLRHNYPKSAFLTMNGELQNPPNTWWRFWKK